ncbi:MAG: hypothetical protein AB7G39_05105 [Alphaproteobacteria bacterium]
MTALLLLWAAMLPALMALGWLSLRAVCAAPAENPLDGAFETFWIGLTVAAAVLLLIGLVGPVGDWALLALLLAGVAAAPRMRLPYGTRRTDIALVAAACGLAAWIAAGRVVYFDTAYYHLQAVRMLHAFGVLQGAHLIAEVYGSVSSWFALAAPFDGERGGAGVFNGLATGMAMAQALVAFRRIVRREGTAGDTVLCIGLTLSVGLVLRWYMVASVTPDLPLLFIPPVLGWMLMRRPPEDMAPILLAAGAATVKLSAAPLVLVVMAWGLWRAPDRLRRLVRYAAAGLPFAVAMTGAFVLASGCFVFPVAATCFDVGWGMPPDQVAEFALRVATGAGTGGSAHAVAAGIEAPLDRLWFWMRRDTSSAALALAFLTAAAVVLPVLRRPAMDGLRWPLALSLAGVLYVAATAPVGRFAGGYIALALGIAAVCAWRSPAMRSIIGGIPSQSRMAVAVLGPCVAAVLFGLARLSAPLAGETARLEAAIAAGLLPSVAERPRSLTPLPVVPYVLNGADPALPVRYRSVERDGVAFFQPEGGGACWTHEPPCGVAARLADLARGLRGGLVRER